MIRSSIYKSCCIGLLVLVLLVACSNDDNKDGESNKASTKVTNATLPPLETSTTASNPDEGALVSMAFLSAEGISSTWNEGKLCSLVKDQTAGKILNMKTTPTGIYSYSKESGARCTYRASSGEELYLAISTSTYAGARVIDKALNNEGKPIAIKGVIGIVKKSDASGFTYSLNIGGGQSNEWIVNAPSDKSARLVAEALISSLS